VCGSTPNVKQQVNDVTPISTLLFLWGPLPLYRSTSLPLYRSTALPLYLSTPLPLYLPLQRSSALALYLSTFLPLDLSTALPRWGHKGWGGAAWPLAWRLGLCRGLCVAKHVYTFITWIRAVLPILRASLGSPEKYHLWPPLATSGRPLQSAPDFSGRPKAAGGDALRGCSDLPANSG
jgi:hypothetical protein